MDETTQTKELLQIHSELLSIRSSLVRHEEMHNQIREAITDLKALIADHELRLRALESTSLRASGAVAMGRTLMAAYAAAASGVTSVILYLLNRLLGAE